ncbi:unnamed protein product [Ascophyllum nodosum]
MPEEPVLSTRKPIRTSLSTRETSQMLTKELDLVKGTQVKQGPSQVGDDDIEASGVNSIDVSSVSRKHASNYERLKSLVSGELSQDVVHEIRHLLAERLPEISCRGRDEITAIRANLWSAMLLGLRPEDLNSQHNLVTKSLHGGTSDADHAQGLMHFPKEDQRVLAADIKRTRQAYAMFKRDDVMQVVSKVLERYCVGHGIRYKQGQNELVAPFVMLQDPPLPVPVLGLLFESFMGRFVSRWFVDDEIEALLVSYRVFRVLLYYLDPGLASKLDDADFVPELYATAWLITLFSRNLSLDLVMRLWDVYLAVNDPSLVFFLLAALLVRNRDVIMKVGQAHMMPETIQGLAVKDKQDLEELIVQARQMLRKIPESFLRTVRSCCSDHGNIPLDTSRSLFCESVRCVSIEPKELLERMAGRAARSLHDRGQWEEEDRGQTAEGTGDCSPCPMRPGPVDTVALDIRPLYEYANSGVGHLGKSLRLDPCLLDMNEILEKWMQHFDGMRGTHLCLVDSVDPAVRSSPSASKTSKSGSGGSGVGFENAERVLVEDPLWRRLLFGEGEGLASGDEEWVKVTGTNGRGKVTPQGPAGEGEDSMVDGFGAAKAFAEKLHARGFPYVSILEGGMEALVDHLHQTSTPLEPTVINHHPKAYAAWRQRARARRDKRRAEVGPSVAVTRAGQAYSWGKGKGGGSSALQEEYSSLPRLPLPPSSMPATAGDKEAAADAGAGPSLAHVGKRPGSGHEKTGFIDRLGLLTLRDGVTQSVGTVAHGVGTVARSGARAVVGGAGMIIPSGGGMVAQEEEFENGRGATSGLRRRGRVDGGNIWEGDESLEAEDLGGLEEGLDGTVSFFGAIRSAKAVVRDGVARGIESVRRSDSWQMSHGVGAEDGNVRGRISTVEADGRVDGALQAGAGPGGELSATGGRGESREMLLRALGTAEDNGHTAIAKAIRARLGFAQGKALRAKLLDDERARARGSSPDAGKREVLESLADLA